jgi:hypothetical protein
MEEHGERGVFAEENGGGRATESSSRYRSTQWPARAASFAPRECECFAQGNRVCAALVTSFQSLVTGGLCAPRELAQKHEVLTLLRSRFTPMRPLLLCHPHALSDEVSGPAVFQTSL